VAFLFALLLALTSLAHGTPSGPVHHLDLDTPGGPVNQLDTPGGPVNALDTPGGPVNAFDTPGGPQ
jgi:hypothetical protein